MAVETYVLLETMDANAPFFQQTADGKRVQIKKMPVHRPTLRQEFYDENGNARVIRYKSASKYIDQAEQIEKEKILANTEFSTQEYRDPEFKFGICVTNKPRLQQYLKAHPEYEGFKGTCDTVREPRYKLIDEGKETLIKNDDMRKRVAAAQKVLNTNLEQAQAMLIRLNGSFFVTPVDVKECQNMLMEFVDDAEDAGLDAVLREETTVDEQTTVLIGKLINAGQLSFDATEGKISKKIRGQWQVIRDMSAEYSLDERKRLFSDFLNTEDGKPLKADLEKDLNNLNDKSKKR